MTLELEKKRKTDREIQRDVIDEFAQDWRYRPAEVGVEVDEGVVTLSGTVSSYLKLVTAGKIAANVPGVCDVANKLTVEATGPFAKDDTKLAKAVRTTLEWHPEVPDEHIDVLVREGVVTLAGTVRHWSEKHAAERTASRVDGVVRVLNDLAVAPPTRTDLEIFEDVRRALKRRLPWAADRIDVVVEGGIVTLMGRLASYGDRTQAREVALRTEGVRDVRDKLAITW